MANEFKFDVDMSDVKKKAAALLAFDSRKDGLIMEGINNTMARAIQISATKYIVGSDGGSRDIFIDPPNPPPGPLKTRSGDLRRSITLIPAKKQGQNFVSALASSLAYAPVHEIGGGNVRGPRPFLRPAIEDATNEFFDLEVTRALINGVREIFGEGSVEAQGFVLLGI